MERARILVVEDEAIVAMDIEDRLAQMGYEPAGRASTGELAVRLADELRPDLLLMDVRLKGEMDGITAAEEILRRFRLPVIFLTAYSEDPTLERAKQAEPYGYILKPFGDRELKSTIEMALYRHRAEEEIRCLTRLYDVLSHVNQAIVRIPAREALLSAVCRLMVERGNIDLAWIDWAEPGADGTVPVAWHGAHAIKIGDLGAGPDAGHLSAKAGAGENREDRPYICNQCDPERCIFPPDSAPVELGFSSCASFPLRFQGRLAGSLCLCVKDPGFFQAREIELLQEVALDISHALDRIEGDRQRALAEERIMRQNAVLSGIGRIFREALSAATEEDLGRRCLAIAEEVTLSGAGFIGELNADGRIIDVAMSHPGWDGCRKQADESGNASYPPLPVRGIYGKVIRDARGFFTNAPSSHPESVGIPPGHPPLDSFLGAPLLREGRVVGLIGLANRKGGYTEDDLDAIEALSPAIVEALYGKRSELALARSRADFEGIFNSISDAVIFVDIDRRILMVNPAFTTLFGYEPEEVVGKTTEFLYFDSTSYEELGRSHFNVFEALVRVPFETSYRHKDGTPIQMESIGVPVNDQKGNVLGLIGIHRDISARKQAEAERERLESQLLQSQKIEAVGRLAGGVAHDFNNMLGVIVGHAELAMEQTTADDPRYLDIREIQKAAHRSADLTRQLLAFARKQTINPKVIELNDTISGTTKMLQRLIGEEIDLVWIPGADVWSIKLDPSQVDQILANLVVNARDAISGVGKITIETSNVVIDEPYCSSHPDFIPGHYVLLAVSDDGCGMSKEVLDHIFEPFFTTKEVGKGTGLGLATVYGIVKQNNGFVHVYSEADGGTTFRIYFRRHNAEPDRTTLESRKEAPRGGTETVLIVEDEVAMLKLGKTILEKLGYSVLMAGTPAEALRLAEEHAGHIDLLITDVVMPEMNGRALAERLSLMKPGIRCLYMSGYTANAIAHHGVLEQNVRFIQKPFSVKGLAEKVREALDG